MARHYPPARIQQNVKDTLAGLSFPDPYRWLEEDTEEVLEWQRAQARLASTHAREWPYFDRLRHLVDIFSTEHHFEHADLPQYAGGQWFRIHAAHGRTHRRAIVADSPLGNGRALYDAAAESAGRRAFLSWIAPSPDGKTLAVGICSDGSENNTIRLIDVATGDVLPGAPAHTLMDSYTGGVQWLSDSSGFFFSALVGKAVDFELRVYLHRRLPVPSTVEVPVPWTGRKDYRFVVVSRCGRYAIASERGRDTIPIAVARLDRPTPQWTSFVNAIDGTVAGEVIGDRYIAVTDVGAARGRVVAIDLDAANANDPSSWRELVPESNAVLRSLSAVGDALYITELVDTYARVRIVDRQGRPLGEVPLPGRGAIVSGSMYPMLDLIRKSPPDRFLFAFSALTVSRGIYSHKLGEAAVETLQEPQVRLGDAIVSDRWATASDGTRVPFHIVHRTGLTTGTPQPTLIYAYGGNNAALVPQFPGAIAAFVAAGGVFVHAHLRGGGELGLEWWQNGRMHRKQNSFDDLYAVAEDLCTSKISSPETMAVTGESNGGLLAAVAATQRPDLWAAVIPRVPVLDLIGACRSPYGRMATLMERANVEEPAEVRRLVGYSPYHLVRNGAEYPAVYIDAGSTDRRCPPWHARKFIARLQRANSSGAPILLHVWENAGHGAATDRDIMLGEYTEWLAFTMRQLRMVIDDDVWERFAAAQAYSKTAS